MALEPAPMSPRNSSGSSSDDPHRISGEGFSVRRSLNGAGPIIASAREWQLSDSVAGERAQRFAAHYKERQKLGDWTYSQLWAAVDADTQERVLMRCLPIGDDDAEGVTTELIRELSVMISLRHPNILRIREVGLDHFRLTVVYDAMARDLQQHLQRTRRGLDVGLIVSYSFQLLCALAYVHISGIVHREIQPASVLLDREGKICLWNFGRAMQAQLPDAHEVPRARFCNYLAPEICADDRATVGIGPAVDIWAAGCVIYEMLSHGQPLYTGDSLFDQQRRISLSIEGGRVSMEYLISRLGSGEVRPEFLEFVQRILIVSPLERPTAFDLLADPFFSCLPRELAERYLPEHVVFDAPDDSLLG